MDSFGNFGWIFGSARSLGHVPSIVPSPIPLSLSTPTSPTPCDQSTNRPKRRKINRYSTNNNNNNKVPPSSSSSSRLTTRTPSPSPVTFPTHFIASPSPIQRHGIPSSRPYSSGRTDSDDDDDDDDEAVEGGEVDVDQCSPSASGQPAELESNSSSGWSGSESRSSGAVTMPRYADDLCASLSLNHKLPSDDETDAAFDQKLADRDSFNHLDPRAQRAFIAAMRAALETPASKHLAKMCAAFMDPMLVAVAFEYMVRAGRRPSQIAKGTTFPYALALAVQTYEDADWSMFDRILVACIGKRPPAAIPQVPYGLVDASDEEVRERCLTTDEANALAAYAERLRDFTNTKDALWVELEYRTLVSPLTITTIVDLLRDHEVGKAAGLDRTENKVKKLQQAEDTFVQSWHTRRLRRRGVERLRRRILDKEQSTRSLRSRGAADVSVEAANGTATAADEEEGAGDDDKCACGSVLDDHSDYIAGVAAEARDAREKADAKSRSHPASKRRRSSVESARVAPPVTPSPARISNASRRLSVIAPGTPTPKRPRTQARVARTRLSDPQNKMEASMPPPPSPAAQLRRQSAP